MGVLADERNNTLTSVNKARNKWGLSSAGSNVSVGTIIDATNGVNNLLQWLREAKNKSGSPATVPNDVSVGSIITNVYTGITSVANTIYNYCKCHGNCTGSCTGNCTGSCRGSCTGCSGSCTDYCSGCGNGCMWT